MSQIFITRITGRSCFLLGVVLFGMALHYLVIDENLTITEKMIGKAIYAYTTLFRNVISLNSYEEIESFGKNECNLYRGLLFGFPGRKGLGLVVEHAIGTGGSQEWSILDEFGFSTAETLEEMRHGVEIENSGELMDGMSVEMDKKVNKEEVVVNFIASRELLEKNPSLLRQLTTPVDCFAKRKCSDFYFRESRVKILHREEVVSGEGPINQQETPGIVIYIHGGGYVFGNMATYEQILKRHAIELGKATHPSVVVYIEYRKSPKWKYPVPLEDVIASISWIHGHAESLGLNSKKLVILGDSAGGNLATSSIASCLSIKSESRRKKSNILLRKFQSHCKWVDDVRYLGLIYPALCQKCITRSKLNNYKLGFLNLGSIFWFEKQYQPKYLESYFDWRSQPLLAPAGVLSRFPKTGIVLVKSDILYDDGRLMYEILVRLNVDANLKVFSGKFW
ncbi:putative alpha/beta hydrolase fold domain containing protein [Cryptosporidium felis]|nr:putative alpha/beta hydrolase fold domain containing protein [Cryptosporidium felis]